MSKKRKTQHRRPSKVSRPQTARSPVAVRFQQVPGVWYPLELTTWSLAHLILSAEDRERPQFAEWARVDVDGLDEWARETIRQVGGEVSVDDLAGVAADDSSEAFPDVFIEDDKIEERCATALMAADSAWWRQRFNNIDRMRVQFYPAGRGLAEHYDRWVGATVRDDVGGEPGQSYLTAIPERVLVSVTKVLDCPAGGDLQVRIKRGGWRWHTIPLEVGDTVVMSPWLPHRVTPVESGLRVTLRCALDDWR